VEWLKAHRLQLGIFAVLILGVVATGFLVVFGESTTNPGGRWRPVPNMSWQWQLTGEVDTSLKVDVYAVDLFNTEKTVIQELIDKNAWVICSVSVGTVEARRPDAGQFPDEVIGNELDGRNGERWLDIRRVDLVGPVIEGRLDECEKKGFDAVDAGNVDGYLHDTGFDLTAEDQMAFDRWLAGAAHSRGLAIGLRNDPDHAADLVDVFDFAVVEGCFAEGWCEQLQPFIDARKGLLAAEYTDAGLDFGRVCAEAKEREISVILKERDLGMFRETCE
jgi:hypothetical protein